MAKNDITKLITYNVSASDIVATKEQFASLTADTPAGYEEVRKAIAHCRNTRVAIEARRVELKADALEFGRRVDSIAKELTGMVLEIEDPLKAKKQAVDDEKARIKAEAEAEKRRALEAQLEAQRAAREAEERAKREAEENRLAEERAALEAERQRLAAMQAELDARKREEEARIAAIRAAEREQIEAERKAEQARIDAEREKLAAERRAEEERQRAERRALEEQRKAEEARQRAEREAIEADRRRIEAEKAAAERAEFERQARITAERQARERLERERAEAARRAAEIEAARPDAEKAANFARSIRALIPPEVEAPGIAAALARCQTALDSAADRLENALDEYLTVQEVQEAA